MPPPRRTSRWRSSSSGPPSPSRPVSSGSTPAPGSCRPATRTRTSPATSESTGRSARLCRRPTSQHTEAPGGSLPGPRSASRSSNLPERPVFRDDLAGHADGTSRFSGRCDRSAVRSSRFSGRIGEERRAETSREHARTGGRARRFPGMTTRLIPIVAVAVLLAAGCSSDSASEDAADPSTTPARKEWPAPVIDGSTYEVPDDLSDAAPGDVLAAEELPPVDRLAGATRRRILYASEDRDGRTVPVSGVVLVPDGTAP